jgi:hypothetical protein
MAKMLKHQYAPAIQQQISNLLLQYPELADDEVLRTDTLEGSETLHDFLTGIVRQIEDSKALRDGTKGRLDELAFRKARFERRIEVLRSLAVKTLEVAGLKKYEMSEATLSMKAGQQRLLGEPDPVSLPDELCRITREPDRVKIRAALLSGETVPGVALSNAEPILTVHIK